MTNEPGLRVPKHSTGRVSSYGQAPIVKPAKDPVAPRREVLNTTKIYNDDIKSGLLVTTYGTPAYVHLQLESRKRLCPSLPCLVVDDCSPDSEKLEELCFLYGADFFCNPRRIGHLPGDIQAIATGLKWAKGKCELLIKLSRRFLWVKDYLWSLERCAECSQYPTFAERCDRYSMPVRSECIAFNVEHWQPLIPQLEKTFGRRAEDYLFEVCKKAPIPKQHDARRSPVTSDFPQLTRDRNYRTEAFLWHDACAPEEYWNQARTWGLLDYDLKDFILKP